MKRIGGLEIDQDLEHEEHKWAAERIGWLLMALLVAAALAGLVGPEPFSNSTAGEKGARLWVEYNRFDRRQAPATLKIHLGPSTGAGGTVRLWIDREYIQGMEVQDIEPEPQSVEASVDRITYVFKVPEQDKPTVVAYHMQADSYGLVRARLGIEGGPQVPRASRTSLIWVRSVGSRGVPVTWVSSTAPRVARMAVELMWRVAYPRRASLLVFISLRSTSLAIAVTSYLLQYHQPHKAHVLRSQDHLHRVCCHCLSCSR